MISVVDPNLRTQSNGGRLYNNNAYDIKFTLADCNTELDHQIEHYNRNTGELVVWVKVPTLFGSSNTNIHLYYGNSTISSNSSSNSTWNTNYETVYHFNRNNFNDATTNNNDANNGGSSNRNNSKIAGGRSLSVGPGNYINFNMGSGSNTSGTLELWGLQTSFSSNHQYFFGHTTLPAYGNRIQLYTDDAAGNLDMGLGGAHFLRTNIQTLNTNQ